MHTILKLYKRDDFEFDIVNFSFLDGEVPRRVSYGVYISQLVRFARVYNHIHVTNINARNKCYMSNFSNRAIGILNFEKPFLNFIVDTMN